MYLNSVLVFSGVSHREKVNRSARFLGGLVMTTFAFCCPVSASDQGLYNRGSGQEIQESDPELMELHLVTPTQEQFTVGALLGSLVRIRNSQTGSEIAFQVEDSRSFSSLSQTEEFPSRKLPLLFSIKIYETIRDSEGVSFKPLGEVKGLRAGEEYLDPATGFLISPLGLLEPKPNEYLAGGVSQFCCVDCGFYTVCAGRVVGCGGACVNYLSNRAAVQPAGMAQSCVYSLAKKSKETK